MENNKKIYNIYGDESAKSENYMVVGALLIRNYREQNITSEVEYLKNKYGKQSEIKWNTVSSHKFKFYEEIVELTFDLIDNDNAHFKAIIVETKKIDKKRFIDETDSNSTTNKMMYQLLTNQIIKPYYHENIVQYKLLFDAIQNSKYPISNCKEIFNKGCKKIIKTENDVLTSIEEINSKDSILIQLTDLLIGGISYFKNHTELNTHSYNDKYKLSNMICEKIGKNRIKYGSKKGEVKYSIWNFDYSKSQHNLK